MANNLSENSSALSLVWMKMPRKKHFSAFIDTGNLMAQQIEFIRTIINYFKNNGILELSQLAQPPFIDINDQGIFGLFEDEDQERIIQIVE